MNSTQSILELNRERYLQEAEQQLLQMSDAYFYKSNLLEKGEQRQDELCTQRAKIPMYRRV
jgi:hypothetical protein